MDATTTSTRPTVVALLLIAITSLPAARASVILADFDQHTFGGGVNNCPGDAAQLFLEHDSQDFTHIVTLGKDLRFWTNGDSGQFDFTQSNSPMFGEFAQLVTDGVDDYIVTLGYVAGFGANCGGGGPGYQESYMLGGNPDLAGSQLEFVRLIVHDIVVEPYIPPCDCGPGVRFDANITWEFWGTPVPEPAALLPLGFGALILRKR